MLDGSRTMENNIVSWITGKSDLQQVSLQELKDIAHQYPYFTLAQLLLTVKMKKDNDPEYQHQLQKTALNFQNPQWLHFQLESLERDLSTPNPIAEKQAITSDPLLDESQTSTELSENLWDETQADAANEAAIDGEERTTPSINEIQTEPSEDVPEVIDEQAPLQEEAVLEPIESNITEEPIAEEQPISTEEEEEIPESNTESEKEEAPSRLSSLLEAQAIAFKTTDVSNESLDYNNPVLLPTKDYFASIGVTTDNTINTDFGQKVKRFSDWLKQMKRVGTAEIEKQSDPNEDKIIMQKADDSNKSTTVLTEAMVDVLIQQGKKQEAIDILGKLSLLKPEKSSYFASLINNLKNNN